MGCGNLHTWPGRVDGLHSAVACHGKIARDCLDEPAEPDAPEPDANRMSSSEPPDASEELPDPADLADPADMSWDFDDEDSDDDPLVPKA